MFSLSKKPLGLSLWFVFAMVVLAGYFRQIWTLLNLGPEQWVRSNASLLSALTPLAHLLEYRELVINLPAFAEAMQRNLLAFWGAGVILLSAQIYGKIVLRLIGFQTNDRAEHLLYQTGVGLGVLSYLCLALASQSWYQAEVIQILIAVTFVAGGSGFVLQRILYRRRSISPPRPIILRKFFIDISAWKIISLGTILIALIGALAPEVESDAVWYHLWLPKLWLQQGSPVDIVSEYISLYPLTWELLYGASMVFGGATAAKLLHFACLPLTALLVHQLSRRHLQPGSPWIAAAIFLTVPTVLWEATTAYVDLALAFYTTLTIYALLSYVDTRHRQWLILAAINLGLSMAIKHLALIVGMLVVLGLALRLWLEDRNLNKALGPALLLGAFSFFVPLPWYLRSWFASGNPVFPELFGLFGAFPAERWSVISERSLNHFKDQFGQARTLINILCLPWNATVHAARYGGSLGPIFLILLPGFIGGRQLNGNASWMAAFMAGFLALWASPISSFQMRFVIAITPVLAALAAFSFHKLSSLIEENKQRTLLSSFMVVLLILNLPFFTSLHEADRIQWNGWLTHVIHEIPFKVVIGSQTQHEYLSKKIPSYQAWMYINRALPSDANILAFSSGDHFYSERKRLPAESTLAHSAVRGAKPGEEHRVFQQLYALGVSHILLSKHQLETGWLDGVVIVQPLVLQNNFEHLYEDERFILLRAKWEQITPIYSTDD